MSREAYRQLGSPEKQDVLIVVDHASNHVPPDIDIGIDDALLEDHIAWDIGAAAIAERLVEENGYAALLGGVSRLVVDLNRYAGEDAVMPPVSDGIEITGNMGLDADERRKRLERFYHPYHQKLASILDAHRPRLILSLHSFAPYLRSAPEIKRPWDAGLMYNEDTRGARLALEFLEKQPLMVGDQKPYSGKELNATMNQHAETRGIVYTGMEIRQDLVANDAGIARKSSLIHAMLDHMLQALSD